MFEESLVESQITPVSAAKRWTMVGSTTLQIALAAVLAVLPLFHPERLAFHVETPLIFTPPPPRPPLPVAQPQPAGPQTSSMPSLPVTMRPLIHNFAPTSGPDTDTPVIATGNNLLGMGDAIPNLLVNAGSHGAAVSVAPAHPPTKTVRLTEGVSTGMLISPIRPVYPAIAKAAGISGTVVVEAIISRTGTIESLHVVRGPEMLRAAALDAIRMARYQPFKLNGEPTEVQTTITINFKLGS